MTNVVAGTKGFVTRPPAERFWAKVDRREPDECWPWLGSRKAEGYGEFWHEGRKRPAHVVAWELTNGAAFPEGMDGCHHCDNPPCVNPGHIFPGTPSDNALDSVRKGRFGNGNMVKTQCQNGHPFTDANTYINRGHRYCRECKRDAQRKHPLFRHGS